MSGSAGYVGRHNKREERNGVTNLMAHGDEGPVPQGSAVRHVSPAVAVASATQAVKPKLRGWLHAGTFPLALAAGIVLICVAPTTGAAAACAVFAVSSWLLFG